MTSDGSINPAPRFAQALPALAAALLSLALFAVTLNGTYVYDDFDVFQLDARLRDPPKWWRYWVDSYNGGVDNLYRPLVSMTYAAQWWLHGADPRIDEADAWKYHLVNVLLHAGVAALVAELARRLAGARVAWVAGLLFAAHPIHVEAVANIIGRAELMCAAGVLGALVLFMKPLTVGRVIGILACFLVALLSKEQGMLTPLLLLVLAGCRRSTTRAPQDEGRPKEKGISTFSQKMYLYPFSARSTERAAMLLLVIVLTWTLASYIVFREWILKFSWDRSFLDWTINPLVHPDAERWLMPLVLLGRYASLLLVPWKLSPDYGATVIGWQVRAGDPYLYAGIVAVLAWMMWFILALRRRNGAATFCLLALALTYGIVSNFPVLIGTNFGERLMYLPSAFFVILVATLLARLPRRATVVVTLVILTLFAARSFTYARRWNDRLHFYETSLREQPESIRLYILLISEHLSRGNLGEADRFAREASEKLPAYWEVWIARANVAMLRGDFAEAEHHLMTAANTRDNPTGRIAGLMMQLEERKAATRPATRPTP